MSDGDDQSFEDTMDVLEAEREETELRFRDLLARLTTHIDEVRTATERSTSLYQAQVEIRREALASVKDSLVEAAAPVAPSPDITWPQGGGMVRGLLNGLSRWLLRDFFEVLDRRGDARSARVDGLGARVDSLRERVDRLQETVSTDGDAATALNEALGAAHQALQAALATHAQMLHLVNAKDAEVLQRAVAGPLRRMEVLFEEFGRQQEALLSQLVGRRRELDRLVRAATPAQGVDGPPAETGRNMP